MELIAPKACRSRLPEAIRSLWHGTQDFANRGLMVESNAAELAPLAGGVAGFAAPAAANAARAAGLGEPSPSSSPVADRAIKPKYCGRIPSQEERFPSD